MNRTKAEKKQQKENMLVFAIQLRIHQQRGLAVKVPKIIQKKISNFNKLIKRRNKKKYSVM